MTTVLHEPGSHGPDYALPPGATLRETLEVLGMSQADLARRTELSTKHVNQILKGHAPITAETAVVLERVTGVPAVVWNNLQGNYDAHKIQARHRATFSGDDRSWLERFPLKQLASRGKIDQASVDPHTFEQVLAFFGVGSRTAWDELWLSPAAAFRQSPAFTASPMATGAWIRLCELEAASVECRPFDRTRFRASLDEIRGLMLRDPSDFIPEMERLCADRGVALVFVPEITGARISGAAEWLTPSKALIGLSLRYKWEDQFWFSFFHEAAHLLEHSKKLGFVDRAGDEEDGLEDEANAFASSILIPTRYEWRLAALTHLDAAQAFAREIGVPAAVVIGRLQHEGILDYRVGNGLRRRLKFIEASDEPESPEAS